MMRRVPARHGLDRAVRGALAHEGHTRRSAILLLDEGVVTRELKWQLR